MNEITLEAVKSELGSETNARGYRVFSREARARAVEYATRRIASGVAVEEVWLELGLRDWTLQRWLQQARRKSTETKPKGFTRLEVRAKAMTSPRSPLVVHGPSGVRVEGLQIAEVAELFRRLSCSV
jgi:transposase